MQGMESYRDFKAIFLRETHVYPALGAGITLTDSGNPWIFGNYVQIVPANAITNPFYIINVFITNYSNAVEGQIQLAYGANDTELANLKNQLIFGGGLIKPSKNFTFGPIPANSQIRARYATIGGAGDTIDILIQYKEY